MKFQNIYQLFRTQAAKYRGKPVFHEKKGGEWKALNWEDFESKAISFAAGLLAKGLKRGSSVAIIAGNIPEWPIADIGTISAGGAGIGIYPTSSPEQCAYIINHSEAEFLLVDTRQQFVKVTDSRAEFRHLREIITVEKLEDTSVELVSSSNGILAEVKEVPVTHIDDFIGFGHSKLGELYGLIDETGNSLSPEETAIMVYTSGTTGPPKGAMLSHSYILNSCESLKQSIPIFDNDICFSYLPHCHVAERISGLYNRLYNGTAAYFINDLSKLYSSMLEIGPTVFASLPRFFEKIHAKVIAESREGEVSAESLKDAFGGRIRLLTSGGAALPDEVADFFAKRGLPILQAYGLTENICVAFNREKDFKFGTVGKPMPMCEVKLAGDGEILIKSPMMFSGYFKEPEKSAEMFCTDGYLKTGDLGAIDQDGFLRITGRKKEIIVLSSGKNIAPALVENLVKEDHLISQCFLYGDGKNYCVALITLNQLEAEAVFSPKGELSGGVSDSKEEIIARISEAVASANRRLSSPEQIKKFKILPRDFLLELEEITPTLKLKRNVIEKNFAKEISSLYEE